MYKQAAQKKIRFTALGGSLTVEDLFDLPLQGDDMSLDLLARRINRSIRDESEDSFVTKDKTPKLVSLELQLEIVKDVIDTRLKQIAQAELITSKKQREQDILRALAEKQVDVLKGMTVEQLEEELAAL